MLRRLCVVLINLLTMQVINSLLTFKHVRIHKNLHFKPISRQLYMRNNDRLKLEEIVIYNDLPLTHIPLSIQQVNSKQRSMTLTNPIWSVYRSSYQLDSIELQDYYISGKNQLTPIETAEKWNKLTSKRLQTLVKQPLSPSTTTITNNNQHTQSIGYLKAELKEASNAVKTASYISRSIQKQMNLTNQTYHNNNNNSDNNSISKDDLSPVTIADFTVQAIIIDRLSHYFPTDKFIAEEDSSILQLASNEGVCNAIIHAVTAATGEVWSIYNISIKYIYNIRNIYIYGLDRINIPELLYYRYQMCMRI